MIGMKEMEVSIIEIVEASTGDVEASIIEDVEASTIEDVEASTIEDVEASIIEIAGASIIEIAGASIIEGVVVDSIGAAGSITEAIVEVTGGDLLAGTEKHDIACIDDPWNVFYDFL